MAEDAAIHDLCEKRGLRDELLHQMRDIFLAFRSEGFLVAGTAAEGDDDDFPVALEDAGARQKAARKETGS
jgi:hypothetical protein